MRCDLEEDTFSDPSFLQQSPDSLTHGRSFGFELDERRPSIDSSELAIHSLSIVMPSDHPTRVLVSSFGDLYCALDGKYKFPNASSRLAQAFEVIASGFYIFLPKANEVLFGCLRHLYA